MLTDSTLSGNRAVGGDGTTSDGGGSSGGGLVLSLDSPLFGIGGSPEGVLAACAIKCMGGALYGKLWPRNDEERRAALDAGYDLDRVLTLEDLVKGDNCFFAATGVTDGDLLKGVHYDAGGATTHSLVMRSKSGTVREIKARHKMDKLRQFASVEYY